MQQTKSFSNSAPSDLSPSFQDWLQNEKAAARSHRLGILKWTAFVVVIVTVLLIKDQGSFVQELFNHASVIAQP